MPILGGIVLIITALIAVLTAVFLIKKFYGDSDKFDEKTHRSVMDAHAAIEDAEKEIARSIKGMNRKTFKALEEDMGPSTVRRYSRH